MTSIETHPKPDTEVGGGGTKLRPKKNSTSKSMDDTLAMARRWNHLGKVIYVVLYLIFNLVFWTSAIAEYMRPADEYINSDTESSF